MKTAADYTDLADSESYGEVEETSPVEVQGLEDENSSAETSTEEDYQSDKVITENGTLVYNFSGIYL